MTTTALMPVAKQQYFATNGRPLNGGFLYTYASGTTTPKATYTDAAGTVPQTNPIVLNSRGEPASAIYWSGSYRVVLKDSFGSTIYTVDDYNTDPADLWSIRSDLAADDGLDQIGFKQRGATAISRTGQDKARDIWNWADFGDDTASFNDAMTECSASGGGILYVNGGTYTGLGQLYHKDNVTLHLAAGTVLQSATNVFGANERFYNIDDVTNGAIIGNHSTIKMNGEYGSGEQRHAVFLVDAHNFSIYDLHADSSGGDGFYIGRNAAGTHCTNILLHNCYADGNRRNNLSIVSADGVLVQGGRYSNASGTSPQYGVDIEPNDSDDVLSDIRLVGVTTKGNAAGGFLIALQNFVATTDNTTSISLVGCKSYGDNAAGVSGGAPLRFAGTGIAWVGTLSGEVSVVDFQAYDCEFSGIFMQDWDYQKGPRINISKARIYNPNANNAAVQEFDKCGVVAFNFSGTVDVGNFYLDDIRVVGDNCYTTLFVYDVGGDIRNFSAHDVIGEMASTSSGFINYVSASGPNINSSITFTSPQLVDLPGTSNLSNFPGHVCVAGASGSYNLPTVASCIGQIFELRNGGDYSSSFNPDNADTILGWGWAAGDPLVLNKTGDYVKLRATTAGWEVMTISWYAQRVGGYTETLPSKIRWVTSVPVAGEHKYGDLSLNVTGAVGGIWGWHTSTEGTPGTQSPVGIIGAVQCAAQSDSVAATVADLKTDFNALLAKLRTSKLIAT